MKVEDGYRVVPPLAPAENELKGTKCGECGMVFEKNIAYHFSCYRDRCPMQPLRYGGTGSIEPRSPDVVQYPSKEYWSGWPPGTIIC